MAEDRGSVGEYLDSLEPSRREALSRLRGIVRDAVPAAMESMRYGMPYYEYRGMLCAFASQKRYMSSYLLDGDVVARNRHLLAGYSVGKGCIRFRDGSELSEDVVRALLAQAVAANDEGPNDHC